MNYLTGHSLSKLARHLLHRSPCGSIVLVYTLFLVGHLIPILHAQDPPGNVLLNPRAIVFNVANNTAYAVDREHDAIYIIHAASQTPHRVQVGRGPISIAVNTSTGRAYVVNADDGTVSIIDGNSDAVLSTVAVGSHPYSIAVNSSTGDIHISHTFSDQLTILNGATNAVANLRAGSSDFIAIDSARNIIYLMGYESSTLTVFDGTNRSLNSVSVGMHQWGLAIDDSKGTVYVCRTGANEIAMLKRFASVAEAIPTGPIPCALAFNPKIERAYVANYGDNSVTIIDTAKDRAIATVPAGKHPQAIAFDAARNLVLIANTHDDVVTVLDGATYAALKTLHAGRNPYALAVDSGSGKLYVANLAGDRPFTIVDLKGIRKP